jgi:hypothetical protein
LRSGYHRDRPSVTAENGNENAKPDVVYYSIYTLLRVSCFIWSNDLASGDLGRVKTQRSKRNQ